MNPLRRSMTLARAWPRHALLGLVLASPWLAQAQDATAKKSTYACETTSGVKVYGDRQSAECRKVTTKVLGSSGAVKAFIEAEKTPAQLEADRLAAQQRERDARQRAQLVARDRVLLQSFPTPADFAQFRLQEQQPYNEQVAILAKRHQELSNTREELLKRRAFYRPDPQPGSPLKPEQLRMNPPPPELIQNLASNQVNISTQEELYRKASREWQVRQRELDRQEKRLLRLWRGEAPGFPEEPEDRAVAKPGDSPRPSAAGSGHP